MWEGEVSLATRYSEKEHWKTFLIKEDQMLNLIEIEKKIKDNNL